MRRDRGQKKPRHRQRSQLKNPRKAELRKRSYPMAVNSEALIPVIWADLDGAPEKNRRCEMSGSMSTCVELRFFVDRRRALSISQNLW